MSAALALIGLPSAAHAENLHTVPSDAEPKPTPLASRIAEITVSPMEAFPGGTVHVTGTCGVPGHGATEAFLALGDQARELPSFIIWLSADPVSGSIDADAALPEDIPPGAFDLHWMCAFDDVVFGVSEILPFTVLTPDPPVPTAKPTAEPAETLPAPESSPSVTPIASERSDELAATGLPDLATAIATTGILTATGATVLALIRRRTRCT